MATNQFANEYRKNAVNGASPLQLIVMLYDGALKNIELGRAAMAHQDYTRQNQHLQQAQKIVFELLACVDVAKGGEIATNLIALYEYVINELVRANIEDKAEPLDHCVKVLSDLRQTWNELDNQVRSEIAHAA
ncbi:MAG: flagellar export chaperone FliS [Fimbriimonadaceae bacterium]